MFSPVSMSACALPKKLVHMIAFVMYSLHCSGLSLPSHIMGVVVATSCLKASLCIARVNIFANDICARCTDTPRRPDTTVACCLCACKEANERERKQSHRYRFLELNG